MTKLTQESRSFIALLKRSPHDGNGWRKVSPHMTNYAAQMVAATPELFQTDHTEGEPFFRICLTEEGETVAKYLC